MSNYLQECEKDVVLYILIFCMKCLLQSVQYKVVLKIFIDTVLHSLRLRK